MSATGRGAVRSEADYYPTPLWAVRRFLEGCQLPGGRWLESGAGTGSIIRAVRPIRPDVAWTAVELREECEQPLLEALGGNGQVVITDFLQLPALPPKDFDVVLGNPPFKLAQRFVEVALMLSPIVAYLLRVNFLGSRERRDWWQVHPADLYVLPNRPPFKDGETDSCEYGWFVWYRGRTTPGVHHVLGLTSKTEMREDAGQLSLFAEAVPQHPDLFEDVA